jgi:benzoate membrane transport protein
MRFFQDFSFTALIAGFVTVLVGFTSSAVIVFQAAQTFGATEAQIASWMWALGIGMGLTSIGLSLRYRTPIATAWSTPGAALLVAGGSGVAMPDAIGAFVLTGLLLTIAGFSGWFEKIMKKIPTALTAAMLAGVLFRFGADLFVAMKTRFVVVFAMFAGYLLLRRLLPRYAVPGALLLGSLLAFGEGDLHLAGIHLAFAQPVWVTPHFGWHAAIGLALPLFVVTMASQNLPGVATLHASGYRPPISPLVGWTGAATLVLAPFGAYALNLAAISAAICMSREVHHDPDKRYVAAVCTGVLYLVVGLLGATVASVFAAFPHELVAAIAGLALLGAISGGLTSALNDERSREPALITFLVSASGLKLLGISSAFWGLLAGLLALLILNFSPAAWRAFWRKK